MILKRVYASLQRLAATGTRFARPVARKSFEGETRMKGFLGFAGMTLGGLAGWWLGGLVGFVTACYLSLLGTGLGLYLGRRIWQRYRDDSL
jgi:hypothetical protein